MLESKSKEVTDYLISRIEYRKDDGKLYWKFFNSNEPLKLRLDREIGGKEAGWIDNSSGYRSFQMTFNKTTYKYKTHQVVWLFEKGAWPEEDIDHIDGCKLNNRIANLREVSRKVNAQNRAKSSNNTSGISGVQFNRKISNGKFTDYYVARWVENGVQKSKYFNIKTYGEVVAFNLACDYRKKMIESMIDSGQEYTERHGK